MSARWMRLATLLAGFALAMCAYARPAFAMPAGLCDDRGATAIAPVPALEAPDVAIARAHAPASCEGDGLSDRPMAQRGHRQPSASTVDVEPALPLASTLRAVPQSELLEQRAMTRRPLFGVALRVERPPRA